MTIDGVADDGQASLGETDNVQLDVENVKGGSQNDTLTGDADANVLDGGNGNDTLHGAAGADTLNGGGGDDTLDGGADGDALNGGSSPFGPADRDVADYSARTADVTADPTGSGDDGEAGEGDTLGADVESITGGSGDDTLIAGAGDGAVLGNGGDDTLDGGLGADVLTGGIGTDVADYSSRSQPVTVTANSGGANDGESGEGDNVSTEGISGGSGNDTLRGDPAAADAGVLEGNGGNDLLDGGPGADDLNGGPGLDVADYSARSAPVIVTPGTGADDGEAGENDTVRTTTESSNGGSAADQLTASVLGGTLTGNGGNDTLTGAIGNDTLVGGPGGAGDADVMTGGGGTDTADYSDRAAPLTVDTDGIADDGEAEGDNVGPTSRVSRAARTTTT